MAKTKPTQAECLDEMARAIMKRDRHADYVLAIEEAARMIEAAIRRKRWRDSEKAMARAAVVRARAEVVTRFAQDANAEGETREAPAAGTNARSELR